MTRNARASEQVSENVHSTSLLGSGRRSPRWGAWVSHYLDCETCVVADDPWDDFLCPEGTRLRREWLIGIRREEAAG